MRVAAFFDIDGTLVSVNTAPLYARYMRATGVRQRDLVRTAYYLLQYRLNMLDIERAFERASDPPRPGRGRDQELCDQWYREVVRDYLVPQMLEGASREHRRASHELALLSSSTNFLARPAGARSRRRAPADHAPRGRRRTLHRARDRAGLLRARQGPLGARVRQRARRRPRAELLPPTR